MGLARPMSLSRAAAAAGLVSVASLAATTTARADVVDECIEQAKRAQVLEKSGKLVDATADFEGCARPSCPAVVRTDCTRWLDEARALLPTVVFSATDEEGRDLLDVKVTLDGRELAPLDGRVTPLDPGPHDVVFERPSGERVTLKVLARSGERARPITAKFVPPPKPVPEAPSRPEPTSSYVVPIVLGGVGVSAIALAAYFQFSGSADVSDVKDKCGTRCPAYEVDALDSVRGQKEWGARISLAAGVVALGAAVYFLVRPDPPPSSPANAQRSRPMGARLDVTSPGGLGGLATLRGEF